MEKLLKVLADPVSNRILQMIRVRGKMTVSEIIAESADIPRATVYRKIEKMAESGAIYAADTHKVRGQTENVYAIKKMYIADPMTPDESMNAVTVSIMQLLGMYENYFRSGRADVNRDKIFMLNYAISLSDKDYSDMMNEIFAIADKYQKKQRSENAKLRSLYMFSAPGDDINE